jgi:hypothetical protein
MVMKDNVDLMLQNNRYMKKRNKARTSAPWFIPVVECVYQSSPVQCGMLSSQSSVKVVE